MKRLEREKVIRGAYRSAILALTICCVFLGAVLVVHELAREYEVKKLNAKLDAKGVVQNDEGLYSSVQLFLPEERFLLIALECNVILVLVGAFFPPLHQIIIDLITQLFTTGKRNDAKGSYRDRLKNTFTALLNHNMPSKMYKNNRIFRACLMNSSEYVNTYIDLLQWL